MIETEITGIKEINKIIDDCIKFIKKPTAFFKQAGIMMLQDVTRHFQAEESPVGKWKPSKRAREEGGKTLQKDRFLMGSLASTNTGAMRIFSSGVEVGTNIEYGAIHNYGGIIKTKYATTNMPKREFMWISSPTKERMINLFMKFLDENLVR